MTIRFHPLDSDWVEDVRSGGPDSYGRPAERAVSDGPGYPCRHCLREIENGADLLVLAARPFPAEQPYAETGPVYLCAEACAPWQGPGVPPVLTVSADYMIRGYGSDDRIVYGSGQIVAAAAIVAECEALFEDPAIAYIHVRSARNNCWQAAVRREGDGHGTKLRQHTRDGTGLA